MEKMYFYVNNPAAQSAEIELPSSDLYSWELWRPNMSSILPAGIKPLPYLVWWLFHISKIFVNQKYSIFLIRDSKGAIVHHSVVTPGYFRFPFMRQDDVQIGDVWTSEEHRGRGLAVFSVKKIVELFKSDVRAIWYLVDISNIPSVKAAEKAGLIQRGTGQKHARLGLNFFGYYALDEQGEKI